jgi:FkbM family methyltransferase
MAFSLQKPKIVTEPDKTMSKEISIQRLLRDSLKGVLGNFPAVSIYLRRRKEILAGRRQSVRTKFGFELSGNPEMESGNFEPVETKVICSLLPHFDYFVNVGANIGYYCCHALKAGLPVIAFEPSQKNLEMLLRNISINEWGGQVEVFPLALAAKTGVLNFYGEGTGASLIPGWAGVPQSYVTRVPASTMDTVLGSRLAKRKPLFLVDVEGAELAMLQGATGQLVNITEAAWIIEITISEHLPKGQTINPRLIETFDMFWSRGFRSFTVDGRALEVTRDMIRRLLDSGTDDIGTHNFMFMQPQDCDKLLPALRPTT